MQPRCHPDTRKELLDDLYRWAIQNDPTQPICWLHGLAGAGKSAIMQTLCEKLQSTSRFGGAFFFKRGHATRGNSRALFVTLAYQLALNNCELNPPISQVVEHDPSIVGRSMDAQLRQLIIEPCKSLKHSPAPILLLDGLDECDAHDAQLEILRLIGSVVRQYQNKIRIIVASRPEADIRDSSEMPSFAGILHSVNIEQSFDDVRTFLCDEFARIHQEHKHTMEGVPIPWPSTEILERLVYKSSGYFIYASTVVKFVDDKKFHPIDRLAAVVSLSHTPSEAPFAPLDQLYIQILSGVPPRFHLALGNLLQSYTLLEKMRSPKKIEGLLELQPGVVYLILRGLRSVIEVSDDTISVYHASFLDFLQDPQRSSHFHLGLENRMNITRAVIKALPTDSYGGNTLLNLSLVDLGTCLGSVPPSARRSLRPYLH
ncbi:hypothetical protein B0H14DRAFT_2516883 [Mycena olivaceomarginata]|nr:hypothetical protein B0H14DRAFT_2516883 [Mycena olivaceomarginata]